MQGNINAILDSNGAEVVQYSYDAWGNHTVSGSNTALGNRNPFRYRGYFYDTDTGFYYLQTRYYDPDIGRFISPDSVDYADPRTVNGLNLYAYCANDPVNYFDPTGHFVISIGAVIGLCAFAVVALAFGTIESTMHPMQNFFDSIGYYISDTIDNIQYEFENNNTNIITSEESLNLSYAFNFLLTNVLYNGRQGNGGKDSGFIGVSDEELEEMLEQARHNNDKELMLRILREMKNRGMRNKRKKRGQPHMREFLLLILLEEILRKMREKNDY